MDGYCREFGHHLLTIRSRGNGEPLAATIFRNLKDDRIMRKHLMLRTIFAEALALMAVILFLVVILVWADVVVRKTELGFAAYGLAVQNSSCASPIRSPFGTELPVTPEQPRDLGSRMQSRM